MIAIMTGDRSAEVLNSQGFYMPFWESDDEYIDFAVRNNGPEAKVVVEALTRGCKTAGCAVGDYVQDWPEGGLQLVGGGLHLAADVSSTEGLAAASCDDFEAAAQAFNISESEARNLFMTVSYLPLAPRTILPQHVIEHVQDLLRDKMSVSEHSQLEVKKQKYWKVLQERGKLYGDNQATT
jgi:hypothetical protein